MSLSQFDCSSLPSELFWRERERKITIENAIACRTDCFSYVTIWWVILDNSRRIDKFRCIKKNLVKVENFEKGQVFLFTVARCARACLLVGVLDDSVWRACYVFFPLDGALFMKTVHFPEASRNLLLLSFSALYFESRHSTGGKSLRAKNKIRENIALQIFPGFSCWII